MAPATETPSPSKAGAARAAGEEDMVAPVWVDMRLKLETQEPM